MTAHFALAASLARPVVRGWLPMHQAQANITLAVLRAIDDGTLTPDGGFDDLNNLVAIDVHILQLNIAKLEIEREKITSAITRALAPMIRARRPWNHLLATAHDINGDAGFVFAEHEVGKVVETAVWFALPPAPSRSRPRHGR